MPIDIFAGTGLSPSEEISTGKGALPKLFISFRRAGLQNRCGRIEDVGLRGAKFQDRQLAVGGDDVETTGLLMN
jgi:hypothetical protein